MDVIQRILNGDPVHVIAAGVQNPNDVNFAHPKFGCPLHIAVTQNNLELVRVLLSLGASVDIKDPDGRNALHLAIESQAHAEILISILKYRPKTDTVAKSTNKYPLSIVASNNDLMRAELLLMAGACPNFQPNVPSGSPPLMFAIDYGHVEMVKLLLFYGADINYVDNIGQGYMEVAVESVLGTSNLEPPQHVTDILPLLSANGCTVKSMDHEVVLNLYPPSTLRSIIQAYENDSSTDNLPHIVAFCNDGGWNDHLKFLLQYIALLCLRNAGKALTTLLPDLSKEAIAFYDECVLELDRISLIEIGDFRLIDILVKVKFHVELVDVHSFLHSVNLTELFPIYSSEIEQVLNDYTARYEIMLSVSTQMYRLLGFHIQPISRKICQYLSLFELQKLDHVFNSNVYSSNND